MKALNILQVEDNEIDVLITQETLEDSWFVNKLDSVSTAEEAILYLNRKPPFQSVETPDLILLDINLPVSNGFTVLLEVKTNPKLSNTKVIILSSSTSRLDKEFAMKNGADDFFEKPLEIDLLKALILNWKGNSKFKNGAVSEAPQ
ncbi:response regulator [uncultured Marivirga sp.]|uniref:response regulator n=1 Tax=uncultured Marivirga sp. TaxID=1123707 RepID=UPI0030EE51DC|tara:strand:- start:38601 stop:39038 length:438 start_codon:yes stop_codon:yes gene_type:complete